MNQTGPNYMDPRSTAGILSRGAPIYNATGFSPYAGKLGANPGQQGQQPNFAGAAQSMLPKPPNSMQNIDFRRVAQWLQAPTV